MLPGANGGRLSPGFRFRAVTDPNQLQRTVDLLLWLAVPSRTSHYPFELAGSAFRLPVPRKKASRLPSLILRLLFANNASPVYPAAVSATGSVVMRAQALMPIRES